MAKENQIQEANANFENEVEKLKAKLKRCEEANRQLTQRHAEQLEAIRNSVTNGGPVIIKPMDPVNGEFTAEYRDPFTGAAVKKTVKFADGQTKVRYRDGEIVPSAALMRLAEGGAATQEELQQFPALASITQSAAAEWLTDLVKKKYPFLIQA
jgi:hypothetical protein